MPELPEVETLKLGIQKYVVGHKILDVELAHPKIFYGDKKDVIDSKIIEVRRVGKGLILELSNGYSLAIHIKLTGQLIYRDEKTSAQGGSASGGKNVPLSPKVGGNLPNKFTHVIFKLKSQNSKVKTSSKNSKIKHEEKSDATLYYNDQRRFGWIKVVRSGEVSKLPFFRDMGPEPFRDLTFARFKFVVGKKVTKIKPLLMDQTNIGGVGNIYANDALFRAGIDPSRPGKTLSENELKKLYDSILFVLNKGLESKGASELSFVNILGQEGEYQNHTLVYGKRNQTCPNKCGGTIKFIRIAGRGTYYCPNCQK